MKWSILDFEGDELKQFDNIEQAQQYFIDVVYGGRDVGKEEFDYLLRYTDKSLINDPTFTNGEWLEVNCHNNSHFVYPTNRVDADTIYKMIEYWHESIAFGKFGDESVAFEFHDPVLQRGYDNFCTDKWLHENMQTIDNMYDNGSFYHDDCNHFAELDVAKDVDYDDLTPDQQSKLDQLEGDCQDYAIDQYIYETGNGYYGAKTIDDQTKRAYIMQINEYQPKEGVTA